MRPEISIIIPVYNGASTLRRSVCSVLSQTRGDWEICAVDDGSKDESWQVLQALAKDDPRIRVFQHEERQGAGAARNLAIEKARGRYIAFLDADDEWLPQKLERQVTFMESEGVAFTCTAYERRRNGVFHKITKVPKRVSRSTLLRNNTIGTLTAVYDAKMLGKQTMSEIYRRQDYDLWLKLLELTPEVMGINEVLAIYHRDGETLSSNKRKAAMDQWRFYRNVQNMGVFKSSWFFAHYAWNATWRNF